MQAKKIETNSRQVPEHVKGFAPYDRFLTIQTFFRYFMDKDVVVTLEDGSKIITSPERADEIEGRKPHKLHLPRAFDGEK